MLLTREPQGYSRNIMEGYVHIPFIFLLHSLGFRLRDSHSIPFAVAAGFWGRGFGCGGFRV